MRTESCRKCPDSATNLSLKLLPGHDVRVDVRIANLRQNTALKRTSLIRSLDIQSLNDVLRGRARTLQPNQIQFVKTLQMPTSSPDINGL